MHNDAPDPQNASSGDFVSRIETELLRTRKVLIFGDINDRLARDVCSRLLLLADRDASEPIDVYINSPGGHVESGDTIHDMVRFIRNDVQLNMIGTGWVASAGAHIFLAGAKDRRFCLPNTRFLLHQPAGGRAEWQPTSRSKPRKSCACASGWCASSPRKPASRSNASTRTSTATIG